MSRHRNVPNRLYSYDDDYYDEDEYDEDEHYAEPGSPTAKQFLWTEKDDASKSLSHFVLDGTAVTTDAANAQTASVARETGDVQEVAPIDPALLLELQAQVESVVGQQVKMDLIKEAGAACQYDSESMTAFVLERIAKPNPGIALIPPSQLGGKKIHVIRSSSAPTQDSATPPSVVAQSGSGSAFGQALVSRGSSNERTLNSTTGLKPPPGFGLAGSVSEGTGTKSGSGGIQAFQFDEPSPDDVKVSRNRRAKPVTKVTGSGTKATMSAVTTGTEKLSLGGGGGKSTPSGGKKKKAVIKEHVEHGTEKTLMNMVVIGHVDAGKSTVMGHLLYKMKKVDQKEMHKFTKESREMGKASFSFAWVMDAHESERERGVTMDIGVKHFETEHKRVAILDAPGHRDFIPNMITGAAQADVAVLVVPGPESEFMSAFLRDGQTREHALLVRSLGVQQLIVAINKMDLCDWSQERFLAVEAELRDFLVQESGFQESNIRFVPISGLAGQNLVARVKTEVCPWYQGPSLVEAIDTFNPTQRPWDKPVRFPLHDVFKGFGSAVIVAGKLEAGIIEVGDELLVAPTAETCTVKNITSGTLSVTRARAGENIEVGVAGVDFNNLSSGLILCDPERPIPIVERFEARIAALSTMKIPMLRGSRYTMHIQSLDVPVVVVELLEIVEPVKRARPRHITRCQAAMVQVEVSRPVCMELYKDYRPFGRFLLRSRNSTDATGMVTNILRRFTPIGLNDA